MYVETKVFQLIPDGSFRELEPCETYKVEDTLFKLSIRDTCVINKDVSELLDTYYVLKNKKLIVIYRILKMTKNPSFGDLVLDMYMGFTQC